jgi:hypothetical protein
MPIIIWLLVMAMTISGCSWFMAEQDKEPTKAGFSAFSFGVSLVMLVTIII